LNNRLYPGKVQETYSSKASYLFKMIVVIFTYKFCKSFQFTSFFFQCYARQF